MWFFALVIVLLIGAVAVVASGRWGGMSESYDDRPDMTVPVGRALAAEDISRSRFAVGLRGYRMDEVDTLLDRVASEVADRDRRIVDLERAMRPMVEGPEGSVFAPAHPAQSPQSPQSPQSAQPAAPEPAVRESVAPESAEPTAEPVAPESAARESAGSAAESPESAAEPAARESGDTRPIGKHAAAPPPADGEGSVEVTDGDPAERPA